MNRKVISNLARVVLAATVLSLAVAFVGCEDDPKNVVTGGNGGGDDVGVEDEHGVPIPMFDPHIEVHPEINIVKNNIRSIYADRRGAWVGLISECKVDFESKTFWKNTIERPSPINPDVITCCAERDTTAENEGFTFVDNLTDEKIANFFEVAESNGFFEWEERYYAGIADGTWWSITINYADGTSKRTSGHNAGPGTNRWNNVSTAFEELTGAPLP